MIVFDNYLHVNFLFKEERLLMEIFPEDDFSGWLEVAESDDSIPVPDQRDFAPACPCGSEESFPESLEKIKEFRTDEAMLRPMYG
jgi:hypothetical protein